MKIVQNTFTQYQTPKTRMNTTHQRGVGYKPNNISFGASLSRVIPKEPETLESIIALLKKKFTDLDTETLKTKAIDLKKKLDTANGSEEYNKILAEYKSEKTEPVLKPAIQKQPKSSQSRKKVRTDYSTTRGVVVGGIMGGIIGTLMTMVVFMQKHIKDIEQGISHNIDTVEQKIVKGIDTLVQEIKPPKGAEPTPEVPKIEVPKTTPEQPKSGIKEKDPTPPVKETPKPHKPNDKGTGTGWDLTGIDVRPILLRDRYYISKYFGGKALFGQIPMDSIVFKNGVAAVSDSTIDGIYPNRASVSKSKNGTYASQLGLSLVHKKTKKFVSIDKAGYPSYVFAHDMYLNGLFKVDSAFAEIIPKVADDDFCAGFRSGISIYVPDAIGAKGAKVWYKRRLLLPYKDSPYDYAFYTVKPEDYEKIMQQR